MTYDGEVHALERASQFVGEERFIGGDVQVKFTRRRRDSSDVIDGLVVVEERGTRGEKSRKRRTGVDQEPPKTSVVVSQFLIAHKGRVRT